MNYWGRLISTVGGTRVISALGGLFVALGAGRAILVMTAGGTIPGALDDFVLIGGPGLGLLYGGYWLARSNLRPDVYPRVAAWCLGGAGVMLGVVVLLVLNPGGDVDRPLRAAVLATSLGSLGGLANGVNNARAISRARDAVQHRDELRQERDLRERLVETSPIGIGVVDVDGSIRIINEHAAEIVGLPEDELTDLRYDEPMFTDPNDGQDNLFERILATGEPVYGEERQIARPDGERIWLSVNGAPLPDPSGEFSAVIFAFADVTQRKRLEAELKATVDRLEQSNDRLRQFAHAASHDLQEPLRMVSTYLQLLENRYKDDLDSDAREFIEFAVDGADRMREMVEDLLAFSRVEQADTAFEPVDCAAVVERALTDLQVQIGETDADIVTRDLPTVEGDEQQLEQLFQNLISNALKYSGDATPIVEIAAKKRDGYWEFSVADNGIGIDPDRADRIFEVFKRLHGDDEYPGTGIGLSLCQKIVQHHGGAIWVESEPGDGSTFYFTIPTTQRQQPAPIAQAPPHSGQTNGRDE